MIDAAADRGRRRSRPAVRRRRRSTSTDAVHVQARRGAPADRPRNRWSAAPTVRRTSSTGRPRRSTASTSSARRPRSIARAGQKPRRGQDRRPEVPRRRWPGPADPRRQERPVALARRRTTPARARPTKVTVNGSAGWGDDIRGDRHVRARPGTRGLYNLYVVDPSEQQILAYPPAGDGGGFPARLRRGSHGARRVDDVTSLYIDGDMYVAAGRRSRSLHSGAVRAAGSRRRRATRSCGRSPPTSVVVGAGERRKGRVYALRSPTNARVRRAWPRRTARTSPSTGWPSGDAAGRTCAGCT